VRSDDTLVPNKLRRSIHTAWMYFMCLATSPLELD